MDSADAKIAGGGSTTAAHTSEPLTLKTKLLYGAPSFAGAGMVIPIFINMPKFYADNVLVPLGYLAMAIAIARSLDALSDPLMGWISDHTHTRLGRRRPYILIGAPLCGIAFFCLLNPPASLTGGRAAIWFGTTFILYFIFHTVYVLPHYALGPELTQNYNERSTLFAWRESFTILGTIVAAAAPSALQAFHMTERRSFFWLGIFFGVLLSVLYGLLVLNIKERPDFVARESNPLVPGVRRALRNRPFAILLGSYVVGSIAGAIPATMLPFFNAYVIRPHNPNAWLSILLLGYFGFGFLSLPMWVWIARRIGKLNTFLANMVLGITGGSAMFFLGRGDTWWLLALICYAGIGFGGGLFLTPSMQADVIDYDELYTGKRREAQYTAFWSMLPKFVAIPSAAIPLAVLASFGYIPNANPQRPHVIFAIRAIFALAPAICSALSFLIARRYPITETIHSKILEGIESHERGEVAVDPMTAAIVAPPKPGHDEDVGWFLDYFSSGELKRYLAKGASQPVRDVLTMAAVSIGVSILSVIYVLERVSTLSTDPGAMMSLIVVTAGLAFAIFVFHLMRLGPARRLAAGEIPADAVRAHLGEVVAALQEGTPAPVVAPGVANPS